MAKTRVTAYTPEQKLDMVTRICGLIIQSSVRNACKEVGMDTGTFFAWLASDETLAEHYVRARAIIAFKDEQEMEDVAQEVRSGEIDPAAARVFMDAKKWMSGKRNSKYFGDKVAHELSGPNGGAIKITTVADLIAQQDGETKRVK